MADNKTPHPPTAANDTSQDDLWLVSYADDDDRELTALQISAALERGEIDANTIVWRDGMSEWKAIAEVEALRSQLRKVSHAPENLRRRQTQLGGFGPAPRQAGAPTPAPAPVTPAAPGLSLDDDEPTVIQPSLVEGFSSAPNQVRPDPSPQRGRHPTSGNTLRIRTGEPPPVTPRDPSQDRITPNDLSRRAERLDSSPRVAAPSDPDLESLPSALLVTATGAAPVARRASASAPPAPTRGVMSRQSDPPGIPLGSNIPRAALTREPDSDAPPAPKRQTDAPKPPLRSESSDEPESLPSDAVQSVVSTRDFELPKRTPEGERLPSVQVRDDYAEADLARQRTRPPRNRREGWVESGTPPPIGELSEAAARIAHATSHVPAPFTPTAPPPPTSSNGRWIGLALFGAAAVAGAFALGKRTGESTTAPSSVMTTQSAMATSPAPVQTAAVAEATAPATSELEAPSSASANPTSAPVVPSPVAKVEAPRVSPAVVAPKPEPKPVAKATTGLSSAPAPQVSSPANDDAEKPIGETPTEPKTPATPGAFDSSAAATALGNAASRASSCRQPGDPSGVARVTVTFANSGSATHAIVDGPPFAGTATGGCIAATMRGATVPAFTGDRVTVKKTVVIQ